MIDRLTAWLRGRGPSTAAPRSLSLTPDLERRIRDSFDESSRDEEHFPSTIDPRIYHVQLILRFFGNLDGQRILDVGCGKGRFARAFQAAHPAARITAIDLSPAMLRYAPPGITAAATMNALPFPDASFDAAYATESLEHAVDIVRAVSEICRVVRPGGKIAVIDKNAEHWGKLETPEWERWFTREELESLLRRHCRRVESEFISYWEDVEPDGLFLAWRATR